MVVVFDVCFVCAFVHMELLRLVDLQSCLSVWSFAFVMILRASLCVEFIVNEQD